MRSGAPAIRPCRRCGRSRPGSSPRIGRATCAACSASPSSARSSTGSAGRCARARAGPHRTATGITSRTTSSSAIPTCPHGSPPGRRRPRTSPIRGRAGRISRPPPPARPGVAPRAGHRPGPGLPADRPGDAAAAGHPPGGGGGFVPRGPGAGGPAGPRRRLVRRPARTARARPVLRRQPLPPAPRPAPGGGHRGGDRGSGGWCRYPTTVTRLQQGAAVPWSGPCVSLLGHCGVVQPLL